MLESSTAPMILTFTGTIIRTECHFADFGDTGLDAYTILPCGWPRDAAIKSFFRSGDYELEQLEDMLHKTYRVTGRIRYPNPFTRNPTAEGFETLRDPEPAALRAGICWRFSGTIGFIQAPRNSLVCLSVIVEQVGGTPNQVVDVYLGVGEETRKIKMGEDRAFMGIIRPDPPWGFDVMKYLALATKEVGNVGKSDVPNKEGQ
jgi:hypothetical protein